MTHDMRLIIYTRKLASSTALLVGSMILMMLGVTQGCADRPRIKYNLTVENRTPDELANVRVSIDRTASGAKFGFLVSQGNAAFLLFNSSVHEGFLLRYQKEGADGGWSAWLPFKTDDLANGWDGEIRILIEQDVTRLQIEPQHGAKTIVSEGAIERFSENASR